MLYTHTNINTLYTYMFVGAHTRLSQADLLTAKKDLASTDTTLADLADQSKAGCLANGRLHVGRNWCFFFRIDRVS